MKLTYMMPFILFLIIWPLEAFSQQTDTTSYTYQIELIDGSVLIGKIMSEDEHTIQFLTNSNIEMSIPVEQVRKKERISGRIVKGQLWRSDPNRTRLFFAPTGKALKAGQGYFSVYEIFFPTVAVGITNYIAVAGGISLFPGSSEQLLYLAPKVTPVQADKFDLSAGVLLLKIPDEDETAGIVYGVSTYGTENSALTLGIGFAFAGGEFADKPVFALGGEIRVGRYVKLISENWLIPNSDVQVISAGIRFFGENLAADFALIHPLGSDIEGFPFLPWIGFAYNFGNK
jgi:hypothetical protein